MANGTLDGLAGWLRPRGDLVSDIRGYLVALGAGHVALGALCVTVLHGYEAARSLASARYLGGLYLWGGLFLLVGLIGFLAAYTGCERFGVAALVLSAAFTAAWGAVFVIAALDVSNTAAAVVAVFAGRLAVKDIITARRPMHTPTETLVVDEIANGGGGWKHQVPL